MPITEQDVLDAFDSLGDPAVQVGALKAELEKRFKAAETARAIEACIRGGSLVMNSSGSIRRTGGSNTP